MMNTTLRLTSWVSIALAIILLTGCTRASPAIQTATYTNLERGISFQYPINWYVSEFTVGESNKGILIASDESINENSRPGKGQAKILLVVIDFSYSSSVSPLNFTGLEPFGPPQKEPAHLVLFNGQEFAIGAYDLSDPETQSNPNLTAASIFDKRVVIVNLYTSPEDESKYRKIFEEFLGSIQLAQQVTIPFEWPVAPLMAEQIAAVRDCQVETLAAERYPQELAAEQLRQTFPPQTDCDWAALALAHAERVNYGEPMPEPAKYAFARAVSNNYGFAFTTPLFYRYFDQLPVAKAPPLAQQVITGLKIEYAWDGLGDAVAPYSVEIRQANARHPVAIADDPGMWIPSVDPEQIQALAARLTDLLPLQSQFTVLPCFDNYPGWSVTLEFEDGEQIELTTRQSNFLFSGGPWQTEVDGQNYVQFSQAFALAAIDLLERLGLPRGEAQGMSCGPDSVFDKAFPLASGG